MIEIEEAIKILTANIKPCQEAIEVPLLDACGAIVAEDIYAPMSVPPYPKSAMDGYAVKSVDSFGASKERPVTLTVIGEVMAGDAPEYIVNTMEAVRIMTGGMIPQGADCVIRQEDTNYGNDMVDIFEELSPWMNYCKQGEDIRQGSLVIGKWTKLSSVHIGVLSSLGYQSVKIVRPMRVGIVSTGSELQMAGKPLEPGKIYNSCGYMLASNLKLAGIHDIIMENCVDDMSALETCIKNLFEKTDLIITTGGVSVGIKDLMPDLIEKIGGKKLFHKVNVKPGTPMMAGLYQNKIMLSLSGNPFAAMTTFELFFWHLAAVFMQDDTFRPIKGKGVYQDMTLKSNRLKRFVRAYEQNGIITLPTKVHSSSVLSNLTLCNCLIIQPVNRELQSGDAVDIIYLKDRGSR